MQEVPRYPAQPACRLSNSSRQTLYTEDVNPEDQLPHPALKTGDLVGVGSRLVAGPSRRCVRTDTLAEESVSICNKKDSTIYEDARLGVSQRFRLAASKKNL